MPKLKWKFAIGTTSLVPDSTTNHHYLICDIDIYNVNPSLSFLRRLYPDIDCICQQTKRGWHIYTNLALPWRILCRVLRTVPNVDIKWLSIGTKRGYLYLADKNIVALPWPVTRMIIHRKKKKS